MVNRLTPEDRLRAAAAKQQNRTKRICEVLERVAVLEAEVVSDSKNRSDVTVSTILEGLSVSRASYFRYCKQDTALSTAVERLLGTCQPCESPSKNFDGADEGDEIRAGQIATEIASLRRQVAACRVLITTLEMDLKAKGKELRTREFELQKARHEVQVLAARLTGLGRHDSDGESLHSPHEPETSTEPPASESVDTVTDRADPRPRGHLKIVEPERESRD